MFAWSFATRQTRWQRLPAVTTILLAVSASSAHAQPAVVPGAFDQQVARRLAGPAPGPVTAVAARGGELIALHDGAAWRHDGERWTRVAGLPAGPRHLARVGTRVIVGGDAWLAELSAAAPAAATTLPLPEGTAVVGIADGEPLRVLSREAVLTHAAPGGWTRRPAPDGAHVITQDAAGRVALLAGAELYESVAGGDWAAVALRNAAEGWRPAAFTTAAYDSRGRLWVASSQGVAVRDGDWRFIDGARGLPVLGLTALAAGRSGDMWLAASRGAVRIAGDALEVIEYRQGRRWLPDDDVADVAVADDGTAWFATAAGPGGIATTRITFEAKAEAYEQAIARHHRRTPHGYVVEARLTRPGDETSAVTEDNDNDGLWTGMYGAAQVFAYAATGSEAARTRARRAFRALTFLVEVTQGGAHAPPPGFPARSIMPTTGPDPNLRDNAARDRVRKQTVDARWKVLEPRWPRSADDKWYWKTDTSSDELDGHYFFYALYHDMVAQDEAEQREVAEVVRAITDHLLTHDFTLVDHDGTPTRWSVFGPALLNHDRLWAEERGLNSLSMLTYLRIAAHVTGDARYDTVASELIARHGYAMNLLHPKRTLGVGGGNQSDDEMAFMNYYHLLKYEQDPDVRQAVARSLHEYWQLERPERNPFFNLVAAVSLEGLSATDAFGSESLELPHAAWLDDTLDTLRRFPLDLVEWGHTNRHRLDVRPLPAHVRGDGDGTLGVRVDGKVLPVDERMVFHWNHDPYRLDTPGSGTRLADGASYLLPYWMARYHRVVLGE